MTSPKHPIVERRDAAIQQCVENKFKLFAPDEPIWIGRDVTNISGKTYLAGLKDEVVSELKVALLFASEKLHLYRQGHSGEYIGGKEYQALQDSIDRALTNYDSAVAALEAE